MSDLRKDIEEAINSASAENGSDTPDWILAEYLMDCLAAFDKATRKRDKWWGGSYSNKRDTVSDSEKSPC
jgi:hypothetical protein